VHFWTSHRAAIELFVKLQAIPFARIPEEVESALQYVFAEAVKQPVSYPQRLHSQLVQAVAQSDSQR
jgi:hypothetical protein